MSLKAGGNTYYFDDVASAFAAVDDTAITGDVTLKVLKDGQTYPVGTESSSSTIVFENEDITSVTLDLNGCNLAMTNQREGKNCSLQIMSPSFTLTDSTCTTSQAVVDGKENASFKAGSLNLTNCYLNISQFFQRYHKGKNFGWRC